MSFDWSHYLVVAEELFREADNTTHKDADPLKGPLKPT